MKQYINNVFGIKVNLEVPSTNEEYQSITKEGPLDGAIDSDIWRAWNPKFKAAVLAKVEAETGIKRLVVGKGPARKDGTQPDILEKELVYFKRVLAETGRDAASFTDLFQAVADSITFADAFVASGRQGRIGKDFINIAESILTEQEDDELATTVAKLEAASGLSVEIDSATSKPTVDSLARVIKGWQDKQMAAMRDGLLGK